MEAFIKCAHVYVGLRSSSTDNTFYRLLPMIYNSNQQHTIMEVHGFYKSSGGGGGEGSDFYVATEVNEL